MSGSPEKIFSVTRLTLAIRRNLLANNEKIADTWFEGEISGNKLYPSGHRYFTLKDDGSAISCVLFSYAVKSCDEAYRMRLVEGDDAVNGLKVQVQGELDLNMGRGQYSFKVRRLRISGAGDRMAQFMALKERLGAEGLNKLDNPALRRPLPFMPHRIGIVTSPVGAVIHDMCTVILRRFPDLQIRLYPVKVQGEGAAREIAAGVEWFASDPWEPDIVIVGRGGGSVEDLWAFNEEIAVMAVARSPVPIISAVGHESDVTLCDYAADLRAGTPSMAAELAVPIKAELVSRVAALAERLGRAPMRKYENLTQQVDDLNSRLALLLKGTAERHAHRLHAAALRMAPILPAAVERAGLRLEKAKAGLELLNPYSTLDRGYAMVFDAGGGAVQSASGLKKGDVLAVRLRDGEAAVRVESVKEAV